MTKTKEELFALIDDDLHSPSVVPDGAEKSKNGYVVGDGCIGCGSCLSVCPKRCIDMSDFRASIIAMHCLQCGSCALVCPVGAIIKL